MTHKEPATSNIADGISLFNAHAFWHAHEAWEHDWLVAEEPHRQFLQGLIQLAAAYYHVQRGTFSGGVRLFDAALRRLQEFPEGYSGVDRSETVAIAVQHRERIARGERIDPGELPKLRYNP
jgi:predicted metal-dependent hydrolase